MRFELCILMCDSGLPVLGPRTLAEAAPREAHKDADRAPNTRCARGEPVLSPSQAFHVRGAGGTVLSTLAALGEAHNDCAFSKYRKVRNQLACAEPPSQRRVKRAMYANRATNVGCDNGRPLLSLLAAPREAHTVPDRSTRAMGDLG